jgi:hypothetical protein
LRLSQNGNAVEAAVGWIVAQRVLPDQAWRDVHINMGACTERWERAAINGDQLEAGNLFGFCGSGSDLDGKDAHIV